MAAEEHLVHRHHCIIIPRDTLTIWNTIAGDPPSVQINQGDGVTASVYYTYEEAPAIAQAILDAAGVKATITIQ